MCSYKEEANWHYVEGVKVRDPEACSGIGVPIRLAIHATQPIVSLTGAFDHR